MVKGRFEAGNKWRFIDLFGEDSAKELGGSGTTRAVYFSFHGGKLTFAAIM